MPTLCIDIYVCVGLVDPAKIDTVSKQTKSYGSLLKALSNTARQQRMMELMQITSPLTPAQPRSFTSTVPLLPAVLNSTRHAVTLVRQIRNEM